LATHVYGNPCDVIVIEKIAKKYKLKVIYDGAYAFGVEINENRFLNMEIFQHAHCMLLNYFIL
jgi:dTDP-4-amino-4,6-dideoxygalactose transaminase